MTRYSKIMPQEGSPIYLPPEAIGLPAPAAPQVEASVALPPLTPTAEASPSGPPDAGTAIPPAPDENLPPAPPNPEPVSNGERQKLPEIPQFNDKQAGVAAVKLFAETYTIDPRRVAAKLKTGVDDPKVEDEIQKRKAILDQRSDIAEAMNILLQADASMKAADKAIRDAKAMGDEAQTLRNQYFNAETGEYAVIQDGKPTDTKVRMGRATRIILDQMVQLAQHPTQGASKQQLQDIVTAQGVVLALGDKVMPGERADEAYIKPESVQRQERQSNALNAAKEIERTRFNDTLKLMERIRRKEELPEAVTADLDLTTVIMLHLKLEDAIEANDTEQIEVFTALLTRSAKDYQTDHKDTVTGDTLDGLTSNEIFYNKKENNPITRTLIAQLESEGYNGAEALVSQIDDPGQLVFIMRGLQTFTKTDMGNRLKTQGESLIGGYVVERTNSLIEQGIPEVSTFIATSLSVIFLCRRS